MALAKFDVEFDRDGAVYDPTQLQALLDAVTQASDVLLLSHGWNNNKDEAAELYKELTANIDKCLGSPSVAWGDRKIVVVQIYWPSKRFDDPDLIPGGGAASLDGHGESTGSLEKVLDNLTIAPRRLGENTPDLVRVEIIQRAKAAVPKLDSDAGKAEFLSELRALVDLGSAHEDDGSTEFFTDDAVSIFKRLDDFVVAPVGPAAGGGAAGMDEMGGAASLGDMFTGVVAAARRIANFTTYCDMKQRAGLVGRVGVAKMAMLIRQKAPQVRLHFAGHSFGGRLVTAAASALPPGTPDVTVSLLQAAFSHYGFAEKSEDAPEGAFRSVVQDWRVSGPIIITHTKNDQAVGIAYPLASRIARDSAAALGDADDPYGGMGRNGAQYTKEKRRSPDTLGDEKAEYDFERSSVYNLRADDYVHDHGDVRNPAVANAIVRCMLAI
jgi:hypothetical protein